MSIAPILLAIRDLLSSPERFTKFALARTSTGGLAGPRDDDAICWCLDGAIMKCAAYGDERRAVIRPLERASWRLFGSGYREVNDVRGQLAVLEIVDQAIADVGVERIAA